ncbi:MAG: hypothetical protein B6I36_08475 [Desulfobacteraceae bacterium 4572_35.1]|nr:MAG: hypothetical protein B6I36_08475 [Desulfobacteraceae bacterium 4572_35.1]
MRTGQLIRLLRCAGAVAGLLVLLSCSGTQWAALTTPDVLIIKHHIQSNSSNMAEFCRRLYRKNPCYQPDRAIQATNLDAIFQRCYIADPDLPLLLPRPSRHPAVDRLPSHRLLALAFAPNPPIADRIYLLALGIKKSLMEGYSGYNNDHFIFTGVQLSEKRLRRLYRNLSQVYWRIKTRRNQDGKLLFLSNARDNNGYINMGYEMLMTRVLTRISDDIYLRHGQTPNFIFGVGTTFVPLLL